MSLTILLALVVLHGHPADACVAAPTSVAASLAPPAVWLAAAVRLPLRLRGGSSEDDAVTTTPAGGEQGPGVPVQGFLARSTVEHLLARGTGAAGAAVAVCGWARTIRVQGSGTFAFLELNDGSTFHSIQVVVDKGTPGWNDVEANTHTHTSWRAEGVVVKSPGKGQEIELKATAIRLLGSCPPDNYPLAKGRLPLEFLRNHPHFRLRTNTHGAVTRVRSALAFGVHQFMQSQQFHYLHTPIVTTSDCEGAGELFSVTTLLSDPKRLLSPSAASSTATAGGLAAAGAESRVDYTTDFFKKPAFLTVSGQLHAEAAAVALGKVYTFGPTFRAENSHTSRHLAEFWMIEPEMAFADLTDSIDCAEAMLKAAVAHVVAALPADIAFFSGACDKGLGGFWRGSLRESLEQVIRTPFARVSYSDAVRILQEGDVGEAGHGRFATKAVWGADLAAEHEKYLTDVHFKGPVVVHDWPKDIKAFYMRANDDGKTVAAMDILFPRAGEMAGGSQREERLDTLLARMAALNVPTAPLEWYLDLRRFGGVAHAGFGVGFDRLVQFVCGLENIRDVVMFPRAAGQASQ